MCVASTAEQNTVLYIQNTDFTIQLETRSGTLVAVWENSYFIINSFGKCTFISEMFDSRTKKNNCWF